MQKIAGAFVIANAVAEANNFGSNTNDDLLMAMQSLTQNMSESQRNELQTRFLIDIYRVFGFYDKLLDISQLDKTIRAPTSARCLSLQAAIGNRGEKLSRTLPSKVAYTALSMRNFALSFTMAFARNSAASEQEINKPGKTSSTALPEPRC